MRSLLVLIFFYLFQSNLWAQDSTKTLDAGRITSNIKIDAKLDEEAWKNAKVYSDFTQNLPLEGKKPTFKSEVRILYDNTAIYVGATLYDAHPDSILHELGVRDEGDVNTDIFRFVIDPYNTRQDAFDFGVSAAGVQIDSKFSDPTFDAVWYSAVKIDDKGWTIEYKIPFSAIRFPKEKIQHWGLQVTRYIRRTREFDQWSLVPSGKANPLNYWGTLEGIKDIESPIRLSFTPYVSSYLTKSYNEGSYSNSLQYNVGADVKYGIDDRFTLDMTLLPDFGQVQSDKKVKNLSYRETTYDENRAFFKESVELFNKGNFLFYSRRIGRQPSGYNDVTPNKGETIIENPGQVKLLNATKISGRTNSGLGIGFFNAVTDNAYAILKDSVGNKRSVLTEPLTNYNIVVLDQQLRNNSNIYFINTNVIRDKRYRDANVSSSGVTLYNNKSTYAVDANGAISQIYKVDSAHTDGNYLNTVGYHYYVGLRKASGRFQFTLKRECFNNTFDSKDMGYQIINNYFDHGAFINYNQYKPSRFLRNSYNSLSLIYGQNYQTYNRIQTSVDITSYNTLLNYHSFFIGGGGSPMVNYDYYEPRTPGRLSYTSEYYYYFAGISSDYRKKLAIDAQGTGSNFFSTNHYNFPALPGFEIKTKIRYRFTDKFSAIYQYAYNYDPFNPGYATTDSLNNIIFGGRRLHTFVNTFTGKYIFSNTMSMNFNMRHYWSTGKYRDYFILQNNGDLVHTNNDYQMDFSTNFFNIDLSYSWIFKPGSILSIVYKNAIETNGSTIPTHFNKNLDEVLNSPQTNSISLKLLYYLDYFTFKNRNKA